MEPIVFEIDNCGRATHTLTGLNESKKIKFFSNLDEETYNSKVVKSRLLGSTLAFPYGDSTPIAVISAGDTTSVISTKTIELDGCCSYIFKGTHSVTEIDFTSVDCSKMVTMNGMFENCDSLERIIWDDSIAKAKIADMSETFSRCDNYRVIDLTKLDLSECLNLDGTFSFCKSVEEILFNKDIKIKNIRSAFETFMHCENLRTIDMSMFSFDILEEASSMFENAGIRELDLSNQKFPNLINADTFIKRMIIDPTKIKLPSIIYELMGVSKDIIAQLGEYNETR